MKSHPYIESNPATHGHFDRTPYTMKPYSAPCVPYRWMLLEEAADLVEKYDLGYQPDREPELPFENNWIQERDNQLVMLDTFFSAVRPAESLCFFYAKDTPLSASAARVIVGVGLVTAVDDHVEYKYKCDTSNAPLRGVLWERNVSHSIRAPKFEDGLVFPYTELFEVAQEKGFDPEECLAFAPDDAFWSFSYGSEHVSHDHAIASVLSCIRALAKIQEVLPGPWQRASAWLDVQLGRLWRMRGPFPGFGSALTAFLGEGGGVVAYDIAQRCAADGVEDPWPMLEWVIASPENAGGLSEGLIGEGFRKAWLAMTPERKELLQLLSRFSISADQAVRFFNPDRRRVDVDEATLIENPYCLYELDRDSMEPISLMSVDRGMLPDRTIAESHPLPERSRLADKVDSRRVRALMVAALEEAAMRGNTLLPRPWLTASIDSMALDTDCPTGPEVFAAAASEFEGVIVTVDMATGELAFQLQRLSEAAQLIRNTVRKRTSDTSRRHRGVYDYVSIVDEGLGPLPTDPAEVDVEVLARREKSAALKELFESRLSVLVGPAGTGKTTLLKMLCELPAVKNGGVLLLAPTGKARVQLETKTGMSGAMTVAQFLMRYGHRYEPDTQRYVVTGSADRCGNYKTVIVDECSMLTEEQLAALLDGIIGVQRLVLVGDPRQLPPIGSGRPFVDIIRELEPEGIEGASRVSRGYAELVTERRQRQRGLKPRADLTLARWFGGVTDPGGDEIWDRLEGEAMPELRFESWTDGEDPSERLLDLIVEELNLEGRDDEVGFEESIGGSLFNGRMYFWRTKDENMTKAESWQVITPVRGADYGVASLNRVVQQTFRSTWFLAASTQRYNRVVHSPLGPQGIIYGDKVINLQNSDRRKVYPERESYVANGDVGLVVGSFKRKKQRKLFPSLEVEFTSQPNHEYRFPVREFGGDEASPPLELAYALTVHKTQGSEFGKTFVVLPNPCWLLSRELLYTALTRQRDRVVILHKGTVRDLRRYASDRYSDVARRLTNVFVPPNPIQFEVDGKESFLEEGLIHRTKRGDLVRSKSEVIIANELLAQGIDRYEYEAPLTLADGKTRYPDFTIIDDDTGAAYYWEHLGMLNHPDYRQRWKRKLESYRRSRILLIEDGGGTKGTLIVTRDDERGGIDAAAIAKLIRDELVV